MIGIHCLVSAALLGGFPGPRAALVSPTRTYAVIWEAPRSDDPENTHHLLLEDRRTGHRTPLMAFIRNVQVDWAPSGQYVAVTCRCGSDFSDVHLFDVAHPARDLSITRELQRRVGKLRVLRNHHAYLEATGWLNATTLSIRLWGYGDENRRGFERRYEFGVTEGARLSSPAAAPALHQ
jgi:hypothetical protein